MKNTLNNSQMISKPKRPKLSPI